MTGILVFKKEILIKKLSNFLIVTKKITATKCDFLQGSIKYSNSKANLI